MVFSFKLLLLHDAALQFIRYAVDKSPTYNFNLTIKSTRYFVLFTNKKNKYRNNKSCGNSIFYNTRNVH